MSPFLAQTPQVQLGSITASGGTGSAVIALTPQTAALQIISPALVTKLEVVGVQSGAIYYNSAPGTNGITNLPVNQSVDSSVTVTITGSGSASVSTVSSAGLIMTGGGSPLTGSPAVGAPYVLVPVTTQGASYTVPVTVRGTGNTGLLAIIDLSGNADGGASYPSLAGSTWTAVQYIYGAALWVCSDLPDGTFTVDVTCPTGTVQGACLAIINNASSTPVESSAAIAVTGLNTPSAFPSVTPAVTGDLVVAVAGWVPGASNYYVCEYSETSIADLCAVPIHPSGADSLPVGLFSVLVGVAGTAYAPTLISNGAIPATLIAAVIS